ncbi:hypothetical protein ZHAS_00021292 [Anopheles sinensis]|uniref:Uncharacterized protein n=1 Tax=Anopheles sinensis TaxID=74873 RepID=A0A084WS05_ANOSI|nr:hypothetical protein ZHAS_00021292 [Anopheles sinensis]
MPPFECAGTRVFNDEGKRKARKLKTPQTPPRGVSRSVLENVGAGYKFDSLNYATCLVHSRTADICLAVSVRRRPPRNIQPEKGNRFRTRENLRASGANQRHVGRSV